MHSNCRDTRPLLWLPEAVVRCYLQGGNSPLDAGVRWWPTTKAHSVKGTTGQYTPSHETPSHLSEHHTYSWMQSHRSRGIWERVFIWVEQNQSDRLKETQKKGESAETENVLFGTLFLISLKIQDLQQEKDSKKQQLFHNAYIGGKVTNTAKTWWHWRQKSVWLLGLLGWEHEEEHLGDS